MIIKSQKLPCRQGHYTKYKQTTKQTAPKFELLSWEASFKGKNCILEESPAAICQDQPRLPEKLHGWFHCIMEHPLHCPRRYIILDISICILFSGWMNSLRVAGPKFADHTNISCAPGFGDDIADDITMSCGLSVTAINGLSVHTWTNTVLLWDAASSTWILNTYST